jgi:hypothetical protein
MTNVEQISKVLNYSTEFLHFALYYRYEYTEEQSLDESMFPAEIDQFKIFFFFVFDQVEQ